MGAWPWIVIAAAVLAAAAIPTLLARRHRHPGVPIAIPPVQVITAPRRADADSRSADLHIRALGALARVRYRVQWSKLQRRLAEVPEAAVVDADELITEVLHECGYPVEDFDAHAHLVSLEHPDVVHNYRTAHWICVKAIDGEGGSPEELRTAARSYGALFEELVGTARPG
jgi:hypothetical protein